MVTIFNWLAEAELENKKVKDHQVKTVKWQTNELFQLDFIEMKGIEIIMIYLQVLFIYIFIFLSPINQSFSK